MASGSGNVPVLRIRIQKTKSMLIYAEPFTTLYLSNSKVKQKCKISTFSVTAKPEGSGSAWIRIDLASWIRIRIEVKLMNPNPNWNRIFLSSHICAEAGIESCELDALLSLFSLIFAILLLVRRASQPLCPSTRACDPASRRFPGWRRS